MAQDTSAQQPTEQQTDEQKQKEKEVADKRALALLDQVVDQVQMLTLPENRIRVQVAAADMLWDRNEPRARSLLSLAADSVAEMMRSADGNNRRWANQLRQELVMTAAQHDAQLAYQLVAATRSLTPQNDGANQRGPNQEGNLEQNLLAQVAALDPKLALQKAEEALGKGEFPLTLGQVLAQLQAKDKEAAAKLLEKVTSKLQSANMLSTADAGNLALMLLQGGPRPDDKSTATTAGNQTSGSQAVNRLAQPVLSQSAYIDILTTVIDAALRSTPQPATNAQRGPNNPNNQRGRNFGGAQNNNQASPTDAQLEQNNARRLLGGLSALLTQIDQYLPARSAAVRQKMTEVGMGNNPRMGLNQLGNLIQPNATADSLLAAASGAPPQMQPRIYQQAALKALDEGNVDRARQIANDHLEANQRASVLQKVDFKVMAQKAETENMDQLRQTLNSLASDDQRIDLLLQLASMTAKNDKKAAVKFLGEAQRLTGRHAVNYQQFEQQLKVAQAFADLEPARSFDVLEPGIAQLNELLSAAAILSGFEVDIFKEGELPLRGGSDLGNMVANYGRELATLAKVDFERAQSTANRFQLAEPRIMVQLSMVRDVLGVPQARMNFGFGNGPGNRGGPFRLPD